MMTDSARGLPDSNPTPSWWLTVWVRTKLGITRRPEVFLLCIAWLARYWRSPGFGLYEDDLRVVPTAIQMSARETLSYVWTYIVNLYGHGRPLSDSFFILFSHFGWTIDGLWTIYVIGYLILALNVVLFYRLLLRLGTRSFAVIGALAYALYAADTTQAYLNHSLGVQPSLTLLLLAIHAYLGRRHWLAYLLAFVILFAYETPFTAFLAAPLLLVPWSRRTVRNLIWNALIMGGQLGIVTVIRVMIGEGRVVGMSLLEAVTTPLIHMVEGPLVSLGTYVYRPFQWALSGDWRAYLVAALSLPILYGVLTQIAPSPGSKPSGTPDEPIRGRLSALLRGIWRIDPTTGLDGRPIGVWSQLTAAGAAMLTLAYPLTFTVRAYAISGRDTRVHAAGVVGAALFLAAGFMLLTWALRGHRARRALTGALAMLFAALLGYGLVIQRDYVDAWANQQAFWTALVPLVEDVQDGEVILVDPAGLHDTVQIGANTWALPRIFKKLYDLPDTWQSPPRVFRLTPDWRDWLVTGTNQFRLDGNTTMAPPSEYGTVSSLDAVIILTQGGTLTRFGPQIEIQGEKIPLKPATASILEDYKPGILNQLLLSGHLPTER